MRGRRIAGALALIALVFAAGALLTLALRQPPLSSLAVAIPPQPVREAVPVEEASPRLVLVVTGVAWNPTFADQMLERLPDDVVLALPADLPGAADRLARWQGEERAVLIRFAWQLADDDATAATLDASVDSQVARLEEQWQALAGADGAVVVEPAAADALGTAAMRLTERAEKPVLLGSDTVATPPRALRVDAALLGESAFATALDGIVTHRDDHNVTVVLLELYPALVEPVLAWLDELDAAGLKLAGITALQGEAR